MPEVRRRPKGLIRVIVVNSILALIAALALHANWEEPFGRFFAAVEVFVWVALGVLLFFANRSTWRLSRVLTYAYAMFLSLFFVIALTKGALFSRPWTVMVSLLLIVYLIGLRGFLNTGHIRAFFGVENETPQSEEGR